MGVGVGVGVVGVETTNVEKASTLLGHISQWNIKANQNMTEQQQSCCSLAPKWRGLVIGLGLGVPIVNDLPPKEHQLEKVLIWSRLKH
jgi:uncharacterized protein (DUF736 family)